MIKLAIPDMNCGHCKASVEAAVRALDAGAMLEVDLQARTASVQTQATPAAIIAALAEIGFPASAA
jgi:copper chaperone